MRKFCVLGIFMLIIGTLKAQEHPLFSLGLGGFIGNDFGGGVKGDFAYEGVTIKYEMPMKYFGGGAYVFLDAPMLKRHSGIFTEALP